MAMGPRPSVAELRAAAQPASIFARNSGEHWAGKRYMRRLSPHLTRLLVPTRLTPDAVTVAMIGVGLAAAALLTLPGLWPALGVVALIQLQLLLDCSDGELARWRGVSSPAGIFLDRMAHNVTEAALPIALAIRADGGWHSLGGWTAIGLLTAVLVLLLRVAAALVYVARAESGLPVAEDTAAVAAPRQAGLAGLRRALRFAPFFRAFVAIEFSFLAALAAAWDALAGDLEGTRALVTALLPVAAVTLAGRLAAILTSQRLR
jgi:phosphatidylglycerophosphate synthase